MLETSVAAVPVADWRLAETVGASRRVRLLEEAPPLEKLIADLTDAALAEARAGTLYVHWIQACDKPGFFRLEAAFRVSVELFDWLFNGRTGYRAAYWLSAQHGMLFNAAALCAVEPAIRLAWENGRLAAPCWERLRASLLGQDSKIWVTNDSLYFRSECRGKLLPARWAETDGVGTCLPMPGQPGVDIKGTFHDAEGERWLTELKADRHERLHQRGFT
jgi:hypothetical protein